MLDDFLIIQEDSDTGELKFQETFNGEVNNRAEVEQLTQRYLRQLEESKEIGLYTRKILQ